MDAHIKPGMDADKAAAMTRLGRDFDHLHSLAAAQIFSYMAQSMRSVDVSFSQLNALFRLYRHGPQRIADLAAGAHLSQCAASRLVSRLVQYGLVEKQENRTSRRERLVHLTPAGIAYLKRMQQKTAEAYENVFQPVPLPVAERLLALLEEILPFLPPHECPS